MRLARLEIQKPQAKSKILFNCIRNGSVRKVAELQNVRYSEYRFPHGNPQFNSSWAASAGNRSDFSQAEKPGAEN